MSTVWHTDLGSSPHIPIFLGILHSVDGNYSTYEVVGHVKGPDDDDGELVAVLRRGSAGARDRNPRDIRSTVAAYRVRRIAARIGAAAVHREFPQSAPHRD